VVRQKKQFEADITGSGAQIFWNDNVPSDDTIPQFRKIILPVFPKIISSFFANWSPLDMRVKHMAADLNAV
jgi:hypothetical protein